MFGSTTKINKTRKKNRENSHKLDSSFCDITGPFVGRSYYHYGQELLYLQTCHVESEQTLQECPKVKGRQKNKTNTLILKLRILFLTGFIPYDVIRLLFVYNYTSVYFITADNSDHDHFKRGDFICGRYLAVLKTKESLHWYWQCLYVAGISTTCQLFLVKWNVSSKLQDCVTYRVASPYLVGVM